MLYYPSEISIADNSMRHSVYSFAQVMQATDSECENPYLELFKDHVLGSIIRKVNCAAITERLLETEEKQVLVKDFVYYIY